ncbi:MAG: hypothetical protein MK212_16710, partial [Saprospiraceae bacterium]|nr:hypothetical protein [Saprospiraceae bacterium]
TYNSFEALKDRILTLSPDGLQFFDLNGKKIGNGKAGHFFSLRSISEDLHIIEHFDKTIELWNSKTGKSTRPKSGDLDLSSKTIDGTHYFSHYDTLQLKPYVMIMEADRHKTQSTKIWNYETNETLILPFLSRTDLYYQDEDNKEFCVGYVQEEDQSYTYYIYDVPNKKVLVKISNFTGFIGESFVHPIESEDKKLFVFNSDSHVQLYKRNGELIRDFKAEDSLAAICGFVSPKEIFSLSQNGLFQTWNLDGELLSSKTLKDVYKASPYWWKQFDNILTYDMIFRGAKYFDLQGNLQLSQGKQRYAFRYKDLPNRLFQKSSKDLYLSELTDLPNCVHQLRLHNDKKEFTTYVYISEEDQQIIDQYYTFKMAEINKEKARQEEEINVLRSFAIDGFGIYNWDRLIKRPEVIALKADFDFGQSVDYNNITVFLICNENTVFKFPSMSWDKFSFDPSMQNRLMAVLPENKVAFLDAQDFEKLDMEQLKRDKKYKFKMKIQDQAIASIEDLEEML